MSLITGGEMVVYVAVSVVKVTTEYDLERETQGVASF